MASSDKPKKLAPAPAAELDKLAGDSLARWACYASVLIGVLLVFHGGQGIMGDGTIPLPYSVAVVCVGVAEAVLSFWVLGRSRPAWAFLVSLNGTMAVATLFGGPRIRDTFEVHFVVALLPCLVFAAVTILASLGSDDF